MTGETGFDAATVAIEAVRRSEDPIAALVGAAMGATSACWESLEGAGVFDAARAASIVEDVAGWLRQHRLVAPLGPTDRVLVWLREDDDPGAAGVAEAVRSFLAGEGEHRVMVVAADAAEVAVFDAAAPPRGVVR